MHTIPWTLLLVKITVVASSSVTLPGALDARGGELFRKAFSAALDEDGTPMLKVGRG